MSFDLSEILKKFKGHTALGLHLEYYSDSEILVSSVLVTRKKTKVNPDKIEFSVKNIDNLLEYLPQKTPVCVSIEGKHTLIKRFDNKNELSILSNSSSSDFLTFSYNAAGNIEYHIFVKQSLIEIISKQIQKNNGILVYLGIGPFSLTCISSLFQTSSCSLPNCKVTFTPFLLEKKKTREDVSVYFDNVDFQDNCVVAYANTLAFFTDSNAGIIRNNAAINKNFNTHLFNIYIQKVIRVFTGFIFIILLCNYFINDFIVQKTERLNDSYSIKTEKIKQIDSLKQILNSTQTLIEEHDLTKKSHYSFYINRIAVLTPSQLVLKELILNPIEKAEEGKSLKVNKNIIRISGSSSNSIHLNNWVNVMKKEKWVQNVIINNYIYDKNNNAHFDLIIQFK